MKITKLNKRLTGAVVGAMALFIGMTPMSTPLIKCKKTPF